MACLAIARVLGRSGRHDVGDLWRLASRWERKMVLAHLRSQVADWLMYVSIKQENGRGRIGTMLRIRIELVPGGVGRTHELARAELGNLSHLADRSDYGIFAREGENTVSGTPPWESRGLISGHDRNSTSVWALVEKAARWANVEAEKQ